MHISTNLLTVLIEMAYSLSAYRASCIMPGSLNDLIFFPISLLGRYYRWESWGWVTFFAQSHTGQGLNAVCLTFKLVLCRKEYNANRECEKRKYLLLGVKRGSWEEMALK